MGKSSLAKATGAPGAVTIKGKEYKFRVPNLLDYGKLEQYMREQRINSLRKQGFPEDRENKLILQTLGEPVDIDTARSSIQGVVFLLVCALDENPGVSIDTLGKIIDPAEMVQLLNRITTSEQGDKKEENPPEIEKGETGQ